MRAVPVPRRSKVRFVRRKAGQVYQIVSLRRIKRKYNLHRLHKIHRRNTRTKRQKGAQPSSSTTPLISDDFLGLSSGLESPAAKNKPLLIASFPHGCDRSPRVRVLQKNLLSRFWISKRKYRLRNYNAGLVHSRLQEQNPEYVDCFQSCRTIRKQASKYADVKINFERRNVFKTVCIPVNHLENRRPQFLEFDPDHSIRLEDYPSLHLGDRDKEAHAQSLAANANRTNGTVYLLNRKFRLKLEQLHWSISEMIPRFSLLDYPDVIIVSGGKRQVESTLGPGNNEIRTLRGRVNALMEVSIHAGNAFNSYNQMLNQLDTISPSTTRRIRRATARSIVK